MTESRARMWRYPAHTRGRRHLDPDQEEVFVPLSGTLTMLLGEPSERVDVEPGGVVVVHPGTPLQMRNESDEEILVFVYGAPTRARQRRVPRGRRDAVALRRARRAPRRNASSLGPASSGEFEIARSSTAGTPASSHARSTPKPSIASTSKPVPPPTFPEVAIGRTCASGSAARARSSRRRVGSGPLDARQRRARGRSGRSRRPRSRGRARAARASASPRCPTWTTTPGLRSSSARAVRERSLDRADPAAEGLEPVEERELALGGGDDEHRRTLVRERIAA